MKNFVNERRIAQICTVIMMATAAVWFAFELGIAVFWLGAVAAGVVVCLWCRWFLLALTVVGLMILFSANEFGNSFQIQPATGKLRYLTWGIPWENESPDAITSAVLRSAQVADLPTGWYEWGDDKRRISSAYIVGYMLVAECLSADAEVGRLFYRDLANEATGHRRAEGRFPFVFDVKNFRPRLLPHWKATPDFYYFLRAHEYSDVEICRVTLLTLIETIGDKDRQKSDGAVHCVLMLGPAARQSLPALEAALQSATPDRRDFIQKAIAKVGGIGPDKP